MIFSFVLVEMADNEIDMNDVIAVRPVPVAAEPGQVVAEPMAAPVDRLTKRHKRLLTYVWSNTKIRMPEPPVCKGVARLLGVKQKLVTEWFAQQRARERTSKISTADENTLVAVHSMDEVVSVDEMDQFMQSVRVIDQSGGRSLPLSRAAGAAMAEPASMNPRQPTLALDNPANTGAGAQPRPQPQQGIRVIRQGGGAPAAQDGPKSTKPRKNHTPEQVEIMARAFAREPRLGRAAFRSSEQGAAIIARLVDQMGGVLTRKSVDGWMSRRPEKLGSMIFPHEDTLNRCITLMRQLMVDEMAKYILPFVLNDPKVLLQQGTGCRAYLIWKKLAPDAWQTWALLHPEEFVRWVPRLLRRELNANHLRQLMRNGLFAWGQCDDIGGWPPLITWDAFRSHAVLSDQSAPNNIVTRNAYLLVRLEQEGDAETDPWHSVFFPPQAPAAAATAAEHQEAIWRCLQSCEWARRVDALVSDAVLDSLGAFVQDFFALFTTQAERAVYMAQIYHTFITGAQAWLTKLFDQALVSPDEMTRLVDALLHWTAQVSKQLVSALTILCPQRQFVEACREFFKHLPGYLERRAVRQQAAAVPAHEAAHAAMEVDALPLAHAAPFQLHTQQDLDRALVQLGQDLLRAAPNARP